MLKKKRVIEKRLKLLRKKGKEYKNKEYI